MKLIEILVLIIMAIFLFICFVIAVLNIFLPSALCRKEEIDYPGTETFDNSEN